MVYRLENTVHIICEAVLSSKLSKSSKHLVPRLVMDTGIQPFQSYYLLS